jgi:hypothetical protein
MNPVRQALCTSRFDHLLSAGPEHERHLVQMILSGIGRRSFARGYLAGCTGGEAVAQLSRVCAHLMVVPDSIPALESIRRRCAHLPNVEFRSPDARYRTAGCFDLIVISGLDDLQAAGVERAAAVLVEDLALDGELVAVHAIARPGRRGLHPDAVHHLLRTHLPLRWVDGDRDGEFCRDSWRVAGDGSGGH